MILTQIDNILIYMDYKNKDINYSNDINNENLNIIIKQLAIISRKQEYMVYKKHRRFIYNERMTKSYDDLKNDLEY
jgi:hypothetical protein